MGFSIVPQFFKNRAFVTFEREANERLADLDTRFGSQGMSQYTFLDVLEECFLMVVSDGWQVDGSLHKSAGIGEVALRLEEREFVVTAVLLKVIREVLNDVWQIDAAGDRT